MKPQFVTGIRYGHGLYHLLGDAGEEWPSDLLEVRAYLKRVNSENAVDYVTIENGETTVMFLCVYGRLSADDVQQLSKPSGVTGLLRKLESVAAEEAA